MSGRRTTNFIDLFSGCGGLSCGLELAGHRCLLGVDSCPDAIRSFAHNHPMAKIYCGDIKKFNSTKLHKLIDPSQVDMVVGGPPCQGFSTVGRGQVEDERNKLFKQFVRIVKICRPKVIIMENVTGMLAKKNASILKAIFREFAKLGYNMDAQVLSSEEYGVPEVRRRTIIIGTKGCGDPIFPKITHGDRGRYPLNSVGDILKDLTTEDGGILNHDIEGAALKNVADKKRLACIPEGKGLRYEKDELDYLPKRLRIGVDWQDIPESRLRQTKYQRLDRSKPSPTILTSRTSYYHPTEARYLTAREAAACQSFPNNFKFFGTITSQFRQIGNAVPPLLGLALGMAVKKMLGSRKARRKPSADGASGKNIARNAFDYSKKL